MNGTGATTHTLPVRHAARMLCAACLRRSPFQLPPVANREHAIAIREAEQCATSKAYFAARPHLHGSDNEALFDAGFWRGWENIPSPQAGGSE